MPSTSQRMHSAYGPGVSRDPTQGTHHGIAPLEPEHENRRQASGAAAPSQLRPPNTESEEEFESWVAYATERADPFMTWLGVLFALLVGYELVAPLGPESRMALAYGIWAIWAVFVVEFVAKLWVAPRKKRFLRRNWLQAIALAIPTLRLLRFLRLLRLGRALPAARAVSTSYRSLGTARRLFTSRIGYLAAISAVATLAVAQITFIVEQGSSQHAVFQNFGDTLLWSLSVVIGLQGSPVPDTVAGRIVMNVGFAVGLVLVASIAGTVGAFLVEGSRERAESEG